jgi:hypothetical protein
MLRAYELVAATQDEMFARRDDFKALPKSETASGKS